MTDLSLTPKQQRVFNELLKQRGGAISVRSIADATGLSVNGTSQILTLLSHRSLVSKTNNRTGGMAEWQIPSVAQSAEQPSAA